MAIPPNKTYALRLKKVGVYDDQAGGFVIAILVDDIAGTFKNEFVEAPRHAAREMLAVLLTAMTSGTPVECHVVQNNQARNFFAVP